jgi:hypothetical protein
MTYICVTNKPNMKQTNKAKKQILTNQIGRLAKIYTSRKVSTQNMEWHNRVASLQVTAIKEKKTIK